MPCDPYVLDRIRKRKGKAEEDGDEKLESLLDHVEEEYQGLATREAELVNELDAAVEIVRRLEQEAFERRDTSAELDWRAMADRMEHYLDG